MEQKFKIAENWNGTVKADGNTYNPGETFVADESLGEGRQWLIPVAKNAKLTDKNIEEKPKEEEIIEEIQEIEEEEIKEESEAKKSNGRKKKI